MSKEPTLSYLVREAKDNLDRLHPPYWSYKWYELTNYPRITPSQAGDRFNQWNVFVGNFLDYERRKNELEIKLAALTLQLKKKTAYSRLCQLPIEDQIRIYKQQKDSEGSRNKGPLTEEKYDPTDITLFMEKFDKLKELLNS